LSLTAADAALDCQKQPPTTNLKRPVSDQKSALTTLMTQIEAIALPAGQGESFSVITQLVSDIIRIVSMPDDSRTCLKGKPGLHKRVAWNEPLPLVEVKVVARALGCSVNDVLLSCVAGAIGTYLRQRGNNTEGCEIRAMVPVNLRGEVSRDRNEVLGNQFGLVPLELPVGMEHPVQRLYEIRRRMQSLKGSYQALLSYAVLAAMGYMPQALQQQVMEYLASKATAIMSNVPGPQQLLYLAGARIDQILFWVPQSCDIGLGISILSYNQSVQFGLMTAHNLVSEPQQIIRYFEPEFEKLLWLSLLSPWSEHDLDSDTIEQVLCTKPTRKRHRP
jgi:diacylglycerol O-acyltransferase